MMILSGRKEATVRRSSLVYLALSATGMAAPMAAQRPDSIAITLVAPGVIHKHLLVGDGPWSVHVVEVDLRQPGITVRAAHADDKLRGLETVSALVHRKSTDAETIVAAINADFFKLKTGEDENNQVIEGEIWKGLGVADSPEDAGHHPHTQLGIAGSGRPLIAPFAFHGNIWRPGGQPLPLDGINYRADANSVVLYTARFGTTTPWDSGGTTVDVRLRYGTTYGDTSIYQVTGFPISAGTASLSDGPVLSLPASLDSNRVPHAGEMIRIQTNLRPAPFGLRTVVGGWPRLVVHGQILADTVSWLEGTFTKSFAGRNPRTGIGISRDSTTLYLITVDGRQEGSDGMSLVEFANLMLKLGVYEGLNLDGGGSTAMVVNGDLVNTPSDKNKQGQSEERAVGNALLVVIRHP
jgi:hypothetical protein